REPLFPPVNPKLTSLPKPQNAVPEQTTKRQNAPRASAQVFAAPLELVLGGGSGSKTASSGSVDWRCTATCGGARHECGTGWADYRLFVQPPQSQESLSCVIGVEPHVIGVQVAGPEADGGGAFA